MRHRISLGANIIASLIATVVVASLGWALAAGKQIDGSERVVLILSVAVALLAIVSVAVGRIFLIRFVPYMTRDKLQARIDNAKQEIWSFQISGGEYTIHAIALYDKWLRESQGRRLKVLFANPRNEGLLRAIVELSGVATVGSREKAVTALGEAIDASLEKYSALRERLPGQVEVRIYDCSPPCSIHAVDVVRGGAAASIFVEHYLPGLAWVERPCILVRGYQRLFRRYADQCNAWFLDAGPVPKRDPNAREGHA